MRDAAVGFQCPGCVAEGARSTRQGRTAYGGRRSGDPTRTSLGLIVVNAAVWLLVLATGGAGSAWVARLAQSGVGVCRDGDYRGYYPTADERICDAIGGAVWTPGVADGALWQLLTSAFTHVEVWHVGFNMLALWVLGPQLEAVLGRGRFLALYLLSALAGSTAVHWLTAPDVTTLGASGAVFGLMGALLVVALKVRGNVSQILTWLGINAVITVVGSSFISWQGHLGGFLGGVVVMAVLAYAPRRSRTFWQLCGLGAVAAVLLLLVAVRTALLL
nr:rhomboid family intramembrane serine protease [Nocardioides perillae]